MTGTYVYCLVAAARPPSLARVPAGLVGLGPVRLLAVEEAGALKKWLVVADAPLSRYGESAINSRLSDLDWVARAAVAHEAVIEAFIKATAVVPMKLFTIFTSDERALEHLRRERRHVKAVIARVAGHDEWGIRVTFDAKPAAAAAHRDGSRDRDATPGAAYLIGKQAQRDSAAELASRAREIVADLHDRLAARGSRAARRSPSEIPASAPLLLDAAYLVPRAGASKFRAAVARESRALGPQGYTLTLSGPWPPYSFMQD